MLEVRTSYRPMKNPAHVGEVRSKVWAMQVYLGPTDAHSPLWLKRCQDYWRRQQDIYGVEFGSMAVSVAPPDEKTGRAAYIRTTAQVVRVLPGERVQSMMRTQ